MGLDLVEVADKANPPVCRIMDYGKYKYEAAQRAKESRKKATNIVVKEMKYRPKIGVSDFDTKTRKVEKFLQDGHKVKITIMFRGREVTHPELGKKILDDIAERVDDYAKIEAYPRLDGRNMTMVLGPDTKKVKARKAQEARAAKEAAAAKGRAEGAADAVPASEAETEAETESDAVDVPEESTEVPEPVAADTAGSE
jgi:translation initiation factor IF-3